MKKYVVLFSVTGLLCGSLLAQDQDVSATIIQQDSLFWNSYNTCNVDDMGRFISDDVEFYHDKGGVYAGKAALMETFRKNLCGKTDFKLRREAVKGSYAVFPLKKNDTLYGAILSGSHRFYIIQTGKEERQDGQARFTHLWMVKDGAWKMTRILSYDHGPVPYENKRRAIMVPNTILRKYAGKYKGAQTGIVHVTENNNLLSIQIGNNTSHLFAEKQNLFFDKNRDLTFEFTKDNKILVREKGNIVEELIAVKQ